MGLAALTAGLATLNEIVTTGLPAALKLLAEAQAAKAVADEAFKVASEGVGGLVARLKQTHDEIHAHVAPSTPTAT